MHMQHSYVHALLEVTELSLAYMITYSGAYVQCTKQLRNKLLGPQLAYSFVITPFPLPNVQLVLVHDMHMDTRPVNTDLGTVCVPTKQVFKSTASPTQQTGFEYVCAKWKSVVYGDTATVTASQSYESGTPLTARDGTNVHLLQHPTNSYKGWNRLQHIQLPHSTVQGLVRQYSVHVTRAG